MWCRSDPPFCDDWVDEMTTTKCALQGVQSVSGVLTAPHGPPQLHMQHVRLAQVLRCLLPSAHAVVPHAAPRSIASLQPPVRMRQGVLLTQWVAPSPTGSAPGNVEAAGPTYTLETAVDMQPCSRNVHREAPAYSNVNISSTQTEGD